MTPQTQNGTAVELTHFKQIVKQSGCHRTTVRKTINELGLSLIRVPRSKGMRGATPVGVESKEVPALLQLLAERRADAIVKGKVHLPTPLRPVRTKARPAPRVTTSDDTGTPIGELKALLRKAVMLCGQLRAECSVTAKGATINRTVEVEEQVEL